MTPEQKERLKRCMRDVETMWARRGIYGGREVTQMQDFLRRFGLLITPPEDADALAAEIEAFAGQNLKYVRLRQEQEEVITVNQKAVEAERAEAHKAHAEAHAKIVQRKKDYQAAAVRQAVDEAIG